MTERDAMIREHEQRLALECVCAIDCPCRVHPNEEEYDAEIAPEDAYAPQDDPEDGGGK